LEEAFERAGSELKSGYDMRSGIRSFNLLMAEWANRGLNLWTIEQDTQALTAGTATYNLSANTVDVIDVALRNADNTDLLLQRMSVGEYASLPDKASPGRPSSYYIQRAVSDTPAITLWQVPDSSSYSLVYWRMRRIQEAGAAQNTADVPFRFIPPLVAGLAFMISVKKNPVVAPQLKLLYDEAWNDAADEDRDRASITFYPDLL
jgi:hypothetical protein